MKGRGTMKTEILPQESSRAEAFSLWMSSPMPMVTLVKTLNVSHLLKMRKKSGIKFTSLMCWCIGRAASNIEEFYLLPENGKLFRFDKLVMNVIVANRQGRINFCDIPFSDDLEQFNRDYLEFTQRAATECKSSFIEDCMIIGTSAIIQTELDCIVNQYTEKYSNPLVMWGKYRKGLFKTVMPVSFQFHHVQMDGGHAARFLEQLQAEITSCDKK